MPPVWCDLIPEKIPKNERNIPEIPNPPLEKPDREDKKLEFATELNIDEETDSARLLMKYRFKSSIRDFID